MQISAEVRLWWRDGQCDAIAPWFERLSAIRPGGGRVRQDIYVRSPGQTETGIKLRAAGTGAAMVEVKSLVACRGEAGPFGPASIWTKNALPGLALDDMPTIAISKRRYLRKFGWNGASLREIALDEKENSRDGDRPDAGCNIELTRVEAEAFPGLWWTLGYEAFGELDAVERILRACLLETLSHASFPACGDAIPASYPEWLARLM